MKLLHFFIIAFLLALHPAIADDCREMNSSGLFVFEDKGPGNRIRGYVCAYITVKKGHQAVLTIKNKSGNGDWDVLVGTGFDHEKRTVHGVAGEGRNDGPSGEFVLLPMSENKRYTVIIWPKSINPSVSCAYFHQFDNETLLAEALTLGTLQWGLINAITGESASDEDRNGASHVVNLGLSFLRGRNVAQIGYDVLLTEISNQLTSAFGGGSWLATVGVSYFGGFLEKSGTYAFDPAAKC